MVTFRLKLFVVFLAINKMRKYLFFILMGILLNGSVLGHLENNVWYFSPTNSGILFNFGTNIPSVVTGHSPLTSLHGCGIATNPSTGAVMFYTDAVKVFDATNMQMPNGTGLSGGVSCAEKGNIVQIPGSCNRYYLIT